MNTKELGDTRVITPTFKEKKNGEYKMIGLFAKKARGMMSRFIIQNEIIDSKDILDFDLDGYKYNKNSQAVKTLFLQDSFHRILNLQPL